MTDMCFFFFLMKHIFTTEIKEKKNMATKYRVTWRWCQVLLTSPSSTRLV